MSSSVGVVVCAYTLDRFDDIVAAIASVQAQEPAADQVVLVIDYNEPLLTRAAAMWPADSGVEVVANTGPKGLSGARNTGVARCRTDLVAFLDDDAAARNEWLARLTEAFADPLVIGTGGRAIPVWPTGSAPATLPAELLWVVGCTYGGQPETTAQVRNVMGCSMAFRRSTLQAVGGFMDGIGRTATLPLGCEETELCIRARQQDPRAKVVFEPESVVDHRVSSDRLTWKYLLRRSYSEGVSKAAISRLVGAGDALSTEAAYTRSILPRAFMRELRCGRLQTAAALVAAPVIAALGYARGLARRS